jgi:hypothetical protein
MDKVEEFQDWLIEWRESVARVGADEALCWILSIYETLDLDKVPGVRVASKWITDPKLVEKRERKAQLISEQSNIHEFRFHPNTPAEEIEAAKKMAEATRRMTEERRYKAEEDDSDYSHGKYDRHGRGKDVAEDEESEDAEGSEVNFDESDDENFDDEEEEMSEEVDEEFQADTAPPMNASASAPRSGGASTTAPSGGAPTTTSSSAEPSAPSGGASTTPSADAPPSPSAAA